MLEEETAIAFVYLPSTPPTWQGQAVMGSRRLGNGQKWKASGDTA
jgi:hypothetical protein